MPDFQIDFSSITEDAGGPVPPGKYTATVKEATLGQKQEEGSHPYIHLVLTIDKTEDHTQGGRRLDYYASFSPNNNTVGRTKHLLRTMGVDVGGKAGFKVEADGTLVEPNLIGESVTVQVTNEEYDNDQRAKVSRIIGTHKVAAAEGQKNGAPAAAGGRRYR